MISLNKKEIAALEIIKSSLEPGEELELFGNRSIIDDAGCAFSCAAMMLNILTMFYVPIDLIKGIFFLLFLVSTSFFISFCIQISKNRYIAITTDRVIGYGNGGTKTLAEKKFLKEVRTNSDIMYLEYTGKVLKMKMLQDYSESSDSC